MIADWRKEMANRFMAGRTNPDLPEELITEADKVLTVVWRLALEKSDAAYADERNRLGRTGADMAANVTQAQERAAEFEREALSLQGELQALQVRLQGSHAEIEDLRQRWPTPPPSFAPVMSRSARCVKMALGSPAPWRASGAITKRSSSPSVSDTSKQWAPNGSGLTNRSRREREIAAGERQYLMRQTDEIRQSAKSNEAVLKEQLKRRRRSSRAFRRDPGGRKAGGVLARQGRSGGGRVQPLAALFRGSRRQNRRLPKSHPNAGERTCSRWPQRGLQGNGWELSGGHSWFGR